jgi:hypothetical protein
MGVSQSWVAFRGRPVTAVRAELGLRAVADANPYDSRYLGSTLPDGWHLLIVRGERLVDPALLARLSRGCEAVACFVEEHVMASHASGWADGRCLWKIDHDGCEARDTLQVTGDPPAQLGPIRDDLEAKQRAAGDDNVDFLFEAPAELGKQLVGYHHFDDEPADPFEALEELPAAPPRKGLWTRLLGR